MSNGRKAENVTAIKRIIYRMFYESPTPESEIADMILSVIDEIELEVASVISSVSDRERPRIKQFIDDVNEGTIKLAIESGRLAYTAGRMQKRSYASASSPKEGLVEVV